MIPPVEVPAIRSKWQPLGTTSLEGLLFPDTYQVSNAESEGQVIERMIADGCEAFWEVGPNRHLTGMMRKINRSMSTSGMS